MHNLKKIFFMVLVCIAFATPVSAKEDFSICENCELAMVSGENKQSTGTTVQSNKIHIGFCNNKGVKQTLKFIGTLLLIAKIVVPVLLIIFGIIEFAKAMTSTDSDAISKATKSFIFKLISAIIIFILPTIINFIFSNIVTDGSGYNQCRRCIFNRNC